MNELDDFLCEQQSDELSDEEFVEDVLSHMFDFDPH